MYFFRAIFSFIVVGFLFLSCLKNNPDPSWLEVNNWTLESNPSSSMSPGELTHNFSEAWVYIDDKLIGVFEVPFKIPLLLKGNVNIKIYPAIKNNGISATKKLFPFTEVYEVNAELIQNKTLTLNPVTRYYSWTKFWIEDFEDAAMQIENDPSSLSHITSANDPLILKYGNYYGRVILTPTDSSWIAYTTEHLVLPKGGKEVYVEIDYYNTNSVTTGVLAISPTDVKPNQNIKLNKQETSVIKWKKMYIDIKEIVSFYTSASYYQMSFQAYLEAGLGAGEICIDNFKVVYF
jgi:hypothetical protein